MIVHKFFALLLLLIITTIFLNFNYNLFYYDKELLFFSELQLYYQEINIYRNFLCSINIMDVKRIRKKSKYKKKGYKGHPLVYTFNYPLQDLILLSPSFKNHLILLIIFIHSRPDEFYERILFRKIYHRKSYKEVEIIHITSRSNDNYVNNKLKYESHIYKDILQFDEISSYFNLSIQTVHMLLWSCTIQYKYLLKSDIDVYINIPLILEWLFKFSLTKSNFAIGKISNAYVIRNKKYSHYVPYEIIKESSFPPYLQGLGYIIPFNTVKLLCKSIEYIYPKIWIEDVFMGYMFKYNNISLIDISLYTIRELPYNLSKIIKRVNSFLIHGFYPTEIFYLSLANNRSYDKC